MSKAFADAEMEHQTDIKDAFLMLLEEQKSADVAEKQSSSPPYLTDLRTFEVYTVSEENRELTQEEVRENWPDVLAAIRRELKSWIREKACVPRRRAEVSKKGMSSRWVFNWKPGLPVKARLVLRGFLDPQVNQLYTASATASSAAHRVLCSWAVNNNHKVVSYDISTAFLQGLSLEKWNTRKMKKPMPKRVI